MDFSMHQLFPIQIPVRYSVGDDVILQCKDRGHKVQWNFDVSHPEKNVGDIRESSDVVTLSEMFKNRQRHSEQNPVTHLTSLQVKLFNNELKLRYRRKQMEKSKKEAKKQWRELELKELELKKNFISFNKFVHENHEKRMRALKKLEDEKELTRRRQEKIEYYNDEMERMEIIMRNMDNKTKKSKIFKEFLEKVVEKSLTFNNINDVLRTYQTQVTTKELLDRKQRESMDILENSKTSLMKLIEEKNFVIMGLNNQIANLQARYENANIKALESEALVTQIKNNAVKQMGEIDTVKNSIWNVYVHMAASKKHPIKIKKDNVEEQMMYINRTLTELSKVNKLIKKRAFKGSK